MTSISPFLIKMALISQYENGRKRNEVAVNLVLLPTYFLSSDSKNFEDLYSTHCITRRLSKRYRVYLPKTNTCIN